MCDSESDDYLRLTLSPPGSRSHSETPLQPTAPPLSTENAAAALPYARIEEATSSHGEHYNQQRPPVAVSGSGNTPTPVPRRSGTQRRSMSERPSGPSRAKEERIPPPYPWAADRRAGVQSLDVLRARGIGSVFGEVSCKKCDGAQTVEVEVEAGFASVSRFFLTNRGNMHDRAPMVWYSPRLLDCPLCRQGDCVRPIVAPKKRSINWLFLLLTQTLGLCTLEQLKYFCKHNRKHRTGAKDRVLYLTYAGVLKQLDPTGPYDL